MYQGPYFTCNIDTSESIQKKKACLCVGDSCGWRHNIFYSGWSTHVIISFHRVNIVGPCKRFPFYYEASARDVEEGEISD